MAEEADNSKLSCNNVVKRLEDMFSTMPPVDNVKITSMDDAIVDKVRFNGVMAYFTENVRMRKNSNARYKNGSLKTMSDAIFREVKYDRFLTIHVFHNANNLLYTRFQKISISIHAYNISTISEQRFIVQRRKELSAGPGCHISDTILFTEYRPSEIFLFLEFPK